MKTCSKCRATLPLADFPKKGVRAGRQRYRAHCKRCDKARVAAWREVNPDHVRAYAARWWELNPERAADYRSRRYTTAEERRGYQAAHDRVRRSRGPASGYSCPCGTGAHEWAYDALDPDEQRSGPFVWSDDPEHYVPMCRSCHRRTDAQRREAM